ncbi:MAG: roadblock/LC7 domain-containing protein [Verrucomicrobiae bacterium]|nr:roadblock/LC7 domain-containing protein [Verrucomicrobiae bacterium]
MNGFPQLTQQDLDEFDKNLDDLISKSDASLALIVEKAGYLIHACGEKEKFDSVTIATLASNAYNASAYLAGLLNEAKITGMMQQGEKFSTLILEIDEHCVLVVIFKSSISAGAIKYYASNIIPSLAKQIMSAKERSPNMNLDFADLNLADVKPLFAKNEPAEIKKTLEIHQEIIPKENDAPGTNDKNPGHI